MSHDAPKTLNREFQICRRSSLYLLALFQNAVQTLWALSWNGLTTVLFNDCYTSKVTGDFGIPYLFSFRLAMDLEVRRRQKQGLAQFLVNSLKDYYYQIGGITIKCAPSLGVGSLCLNDPLGKRNFDVYWHPLDKDPDTGKGPAGDGR